MPDKWTSETLLELARAYQPGCVLLAAAELDIFDALANEPQTAADLATTVRGNRRATTILADALTALEILEKQNGYYSPAPGILEMLTEGGSKSVLSMLRHQANCLRSWAQLATVVRTGNPADRSHSIRGADGDRDAFIEAMEVVSRAAAPDVVASLGPPSFKHMLDVGGGPATWTIAFLKAVPDARVTVYDLPGVIPIARRHVDAAGLAHRVEFVGGNFATDEHLPNRIDLAWVSAIVHQNSRRENRELFAKIHTALVSDGQIMIRDIVMEDSHTSPPLGALFAINMLVNTEGGGTYSLAELQDDLHDAGFGDPILLRGQRDMDSVVRASKV